MSASVDPDLDFFISHASVDDARVSLLDEAMNKAGLTTWVDHEHGITYGERWQKAIQDATIRCGAGIYVLTPASARSEWCERELTQLIESLKRRVYVVILSEIPAHDIPLIVNNTQYKDLTKADLSNPADPLLTALIDALKGRTPFADRERLTETRRTHRITGAFPYGELQHTLYGRETDLSALQTYFGDTGGAVHIAQVLGIGGVGKTRLAVEVVERMDFREGAIWFRFNKENPDNLNAPNAIAALIRDHLNLPASVPEDRTWKALCDGEALLVLDNAEDCPSGQRRAFADQLQALNGGVRVLITSRNAWRELERIARKPYDLHAPDPASGVRILTRMAEVNGYGERLGSFAEKLAQQARYHPRLMLYAVGWLGDYTAQLVIKALETLRGEEVEAVLEEMVGTSIRQMVSQKGPAPLDSLRRLAVTVDGFDTQAMQALLADRFAADPMLGDIKTLRSWNLLEFDGKRYSIDPLVVHAAGVDETARAIHAAHYADRLKEQDEKQDYAALMAEIGNLNTGFAWAVEKREVNLALKYARYGGYFWRNRGDIRTLFAWTQDAAALTDEQRDEMQWAAGQHYLGLAYEELSRLENRQANLTKAIGLYINALSYRTPTVAPFLYASSQNNLGNAYLNLSSLQNKGINLRHALIAFKEALKYYMPDQTPLNYGLVLNNIGSAYCTLADLEEREQNLYRGIDAFNQASKYITAASTPLDYAMVQSNLGATYRDLFILKQSKEDLHKALAAFAQAMNYWTPATFPYGYAIAQFNTGLTLRDLAKLENSENNLRLAVSAYSEALKYSSPITAPIQYAKVQTNMGLALSLQGNIDGACAAWKEARYYYLQIGLQEQAIQIESYLRKYGC